MKKLTLKEENRREYQRSYTGSPIKYTAIQIDIYDKACGSASCVDIVLVEISEKGREKKVSYVLNKEKALLLRSMLNEINF